MTIAALYDIHGNLPALEAVVAELRRETIERVVVGGDVMPGPMPRECLTLLRRLEWPVEFIVGNGDLAALDERAGRVSGAPEAWRDSIRWCGHQLSDEETRFVEAWPVTLRHDAALFCHATPRDVNEIFTAGTDDAKLRPIFDAAGANLVVCGHTHMQFDRMVGSTRVVNAGSVGMPFGRRGADWLLVGERIELRHTDYDLETSVARVRATLDPGAEEFALRYLLDPPSADFIRAAFAKVELTA
jgi:predicted phosphodiesterase